MDPSAGADKALRAELTRLRGELEQALVSAEDAQNEVAALVGERVALIAARDRHLAAWQAAEQSAGTLRVSLANALEMLAHQQANEAASSATDEELTVAFEEAQTLAEELVAANDALMRSNHELDHRVGERTAALDAANRALETINADLQRRVDEETAARQEAQFRLFQAQKLEAIGQLTGGIAHDFNNLLTAILGYARFAADGLAPGDRRRLDMDQVLKAAQLGSGLTRQLLALSRKPTSRPAFIDLNALLTGLSQMVRLIAGEHIKVEIVLAPGLAMVRADEGQLEQIVVNLAVDARDVMEPGGRLRFETANVQLHAASGLPGQTVVPGWYVMLALEPFPRIREHGGGPGPGLATVHDIVKQSDGFIRIDGLPGSGSALKVYLPRAERPVEAGAPAGGRPA